MGVVLSSSTEHAVVIIILCVSKGLLTGGGTLAATRKQCPHCLHAKRCRPAGKLDGLFSVATVTVTLLQALESPFFLNKAKVMLRGYF